MNFAKKHCDLDNYLPVLSLVAEQTVADQCQEVKPVYYDSQHAHSD